MLYIDTFSLCSHVACLRDRCRICLFKFYVLGNGSIELYQYCMYNSFDNKLPSTEIMWLNVLFFHVIMIIFMFKGLISCMK